MDSSCIQDKCYARALRSVGRASNTLMVSKWADVPAFQEAETRKELCQKHPLCSRLLLCFKLPQMLTWRFVTALTQVFPEGVHLALLLIPNPHHQGLNHQYSPLSPTCLVVSPCFHSCQRDSEPSFQKIECRLCFTLWICSLCFLSLDLRGWALIGFEIWDWVPVNSIRSQKKNGVTEGPLIFDPSPLMAAVITVGGCSEQDCIVSVYCGLASTVSLCRISHFNQGMCPSTQGKGWRRKAELASVAILQRVRTWGGNIRGKWSYQ